LTAQLFIDLEIIGNAILLGINGALLFKQQTSIHRLDSLIYHVNLKSKLLDAKI